VAIKAEDVKKLRDKTGAGMMDCKKALTDAEGDFARAEKILKELGLAAAAKRSGRATNEGRIFTRITEGKAGILELACETDFVARNSDFAALGNSIIEEMMEKDLAADDAGIQAKIQDAVATIKENMGVRRFQTMPVSDSEVAVDYIHGDGGNIGVVVKLSVEKPELVGDERVKAFAFDVALHVAAFNPAFLSEDRVSPAYLKEQEEIFTTQAKNMGKPENVVVGIVKGKMKKHLSEICLLDQPFVKDDKRSVSKVAKDLSTEVGAGVTVAEYLYYRVGEEVSE